MTDTPDNKDIPVAAMAWAPEDQAGRWAKYVRHVVASSILVIALASIVVWAGQHFSKRADMTITSSYSLKPQTLAVIQNNSKPIKLISLYARLKPDQAAPGQQDFAQPVADTLEEYRRMGKNIDVEIIDPVADPARLDAWVGEITHKYGGDVKGYRQLLETFPATLDQIKKLADEQLEKLNALAKSGLKLSSQKQAETVQVVQLTVLAFPEVLQKIDEGVKEELDKKIPDYKDGVEEVRSTLDGFSEQVTKIKTALEQLRDDKTAPQSARDYAKDNIAKFDSMKKLADDELAAIKGLGELKLDDVRRKLSVDDENGNTAIRTIAVEGPDDIKLIDFTDVWTSGDTAGLLNDSNTESRLRFSGERQLTAAILSLTQPRKKVAFIRCGGPPLTTPNQQRAPSQMFTAAVERLRADNFEVLEKDITGHWAQMQAMQQQQMPPTPEASDDQIKDAIWIVVDEQEMAMSPFGGQMPMPVPELGNKLSAHLDRPLYSGSDLRVDIVDATKVGSASHAFTIDDVGQSIKITGGTPWTSGSYEIRSVKDGLAVLDRSPAPSQTAGGAWAQGKQSALILVGYKGGDLSDTLGTWGVNIKSSFVAVHEKVGSGNDETTDFIEAARRAPPIFVFNNYGESPVTTPLNSLDAAMVPIIPIQTTSTPDCNVMPILPLPTEPRSWGESNVDSLRDPKGPTYDPKDDLPPPIFGGAVVEKNYKSGDTGRLVVIGSDTFADNELLTLPDPQLLTRSHIIVSRFPGNGELFTNSIFWLAHMDKMIALSPAALDTPRIAPMSNKMLNFWRFGVLLIGLPLLAIFAGIYVWRTRQD